METCEKEQTISTPKEREVNFKADYAKIRRQDTQEYDKDTTLQVEEPGEAQPPQRRTIHLSQEWTFKEDSRKIPSPSIE